MNIISHNLISFYILKNKFPNLTLITQDPQFPTQMDPLGGGYQ